MKFYQLTNYDMFSQKLVIENNLENPKLGRESIS